MSSLFSTSFDTFSTALDFNPIGVDVVEYVLVPSVAPYEAYLKYLPKNSSISISTLRVLNTESNLRKGFYYCDYRYGKLVFNESEAGTIQQVFYKALGTHINARLINKFQDSIQKLESELGAFAVQRSTGLVVKVAPGRALLNSTLIISEIYSSVNLPANSSNYIYLTASGIEHGSSFPSTALPLALVVTNSSEVVSISDRRCYLSSGGVGGGSTALFLAPEYANTVAGAGTATLNLEHDYTNFHNFYVVTTDGKGSCYKDLCTRIRMPDQAKLSSLSVFLTSCGTACLDLYIYDTQNQLAVSLTGLTASNLTAYTTFLAQ